MSRLCSKVHKIDKEGFGQAYILVLVRAQAVLDSGEISGCKERAHGRVLEAGGHDGQAAAISYAGKRK